MTSTPKDRQAEANSTPITPPPSTIAERGKPVEPERLLAGEDFHAVDLQPWQRARVRPSGQYQIGRLVRLVADSDGRASVTLGSADPHLERR